MCHTDVTFEPSFHSLSGPGLASSSTSLSPVSQSPRVSTSTTWCRQCARDDLHHIFNSVECVAYQKSTSCHACGTGPHPPCWTTNPECPFFHHGAGSRIDDPDAQATGESAPDLFPRGEVELHLRGHRQTWTATVDDRDYVVGEASGHGFNCLIRSLWAAINDHVLFMVNYADIRQHLQQLDLQMRC